MLILFISIIIIPFVGFCVAFIGSYFFGNKKYITYFPTVLLGINALIAFHLFHSVSYDSYKTAETWLDTKFPDSAILKDSVYDA